MRQAAEFYNDTKNEEGWKIFEWGENGDASIEEKDIMISSLAHLDEEDTERFHYKSFVSLSLLRYAKSMPIQAVTTVGLVRVGRTENTKTLADVSIVRIPKGRANDNNCGEMMAVWLHDNRFLVALKEAQNECSDFQYACRLINSNLRKPDGEESFLMVCSPLMMLCANKQTGLRIGLKAFM